MLKNKTKKSVEIALEKILLKHPSALTLAMVKGWILNDEGESTMDASNRFQIKWTKYFEKEWNAGGAELDEILQAFSDGWNHLPHKSLNGISPYKKFREIYGENPPEKGSADEMPRVVVGGHEMSWEEHQAMLKNMEKEQEPFKKWIDKSLKEYHIFLEESEFPEKTVEKYYRVAGIFFERVLWVGFLDLESIRPAFIKEEFPKWWQTHVMFLSMRPEEVCLALRRFFKFIEEQK